MEIESKLGTITGELLTDAMAAGAALTKIQHVDGIPIALIPEGYSLKTLEHLIEEDRRRESICQETRLLSADSFVEYVAAYKDDRTVVFANRDESCLVGLLDFHRPGKRELCAHRAVHSAQLSREMQGWKQNDRRKKSQVEFAEFIEGNVDHITEPAGARMLEYALTLQAKRKVDFRSAVRLDNGEIQFKFEEQINGAKQGGQVDIPSEFKIGIPVYQDGDKYAIRARLRYRIGREDGALTMWYELVNLDAVIEDAFNSVLSKLDPLCVPVYMGSVR